MNNSRPFIDQLEERKRGFQDKIEKGKIKFISKVSQEEADELGNQLYRKISSSSFVDGDEAVLKELTKLIKQGANVNVLVKDGKDTPLLKCCKLNYPKTVILLLCAGVDVNQTNNYGTTPLMSAARHNAKDIVKQLIWMGADVNKRCQDGDTALIQALRHSSVASADILVANQAYLTCKNVEGESIFDFLSVPIHLPQEYLEEIRNSEVTHEYAMSTIEEAKQALEKIKK